jgi:hypothetical protein
VLSAPFWPAPEIFGMLHALPGQTPPSAEETEAALQVPEGLDPRIRAMADELSDGATSDAQRVDRTLFWLAREHRYALDVGPFESDQPVAEFLFEKKRGYCEYFASAAALLLRLQGVPTRYVAGFNVRDGSRSGEHYLVRVSDSHAWIETWLEGTGWREADPTPAAQYAALHGDESPSWLARGWEVAAALWAEARVRLSHDWQDGLGWLGRRLAALGAGLAWPALGAALVAAAMLLLRLVFTRLRQRRQAAGAPGHDASSHVRPELAMLLRRVDDSLASRGHPRAPHLAPLEHLERLPDEALPQQARAAGREVVNRYYEERFGGHRTTRDELDRLDRLIGIAFDAAQPRSR